MRNTLKLTACGAIILLALSACAADETTATVEATQATQQGIIDAFLSGEPEGADAFYAEKIEFDDPTFTNHLAGKAALKKQAATIYPWTDVDQTRLIDQFVSADGTRGTIRYSWIGTSTFSGPFHLILTQVLEYEDSKAISITNYYGNSDAYAQLTG